MAKATSSRSFYCLCSVTLAAAFLAAQPSSAQSIDFGANLGTLNYKITSESRSCDSGNVTYEKTIFSNLTYVNSPAGINQALGAVPYTTTVPKNKIGVGGCPPDSNGPITYKGNGYTIVLNPENGALSATITASGYINPKYVVVGILYAPPGGVVEGGIAQGNVDYTNSNLVSSTITTKESWGTSYTQSSVVTLPGIGFNIFGWVKGSVSSSSSTSYTTATTTTDSTAVTVQKVSGTTIGVNGPTCPYCGVDHDYDIIELWLNPVELYTLTNGGVVQPNGYGYSTLDQPGMDVYDVYAGELNGDLPVRSSTTTAFARAWAGGEVWPSGQGPGLTSQDEQNILQMDPYWDCTYASPWTDTGTAACAKPPDPNRFTESAGDQNFPYTQPDPGGSPNYKKYSFSYTNTDTQGIDIVNKTSQTYGEESTYTVSIFGIGFKDAIGTSYTITHSYETSSQFTSSNTTTAEATIWQPPCNVVSGVCNPAYPPTHAFNPITCTAITTLGQSFGQGDSMYVYQDNLFGTFLVEPYGK